MLRRCSHTLFVLIVLAVVVAGRADAAGPGEAAAHSGPPVLAGSEPDYPPYCIVTPAGQADGFSVELLRAALKAVGLDVTFRVGPWASLRDDLLARLTEGLATVKATGEFRKIQSRWLGPYELSGPGLYLIVKYVLIGVLPLLALLIGSVLWSRSLQRQVASRTLELTREITERQAAQEELRHSQKMEAIALLAGGVAHNFNNILQAISSQLALVKMKLAREDPSMERLERVTAEIRRAARLTEQLVTFSRQQRETPDRLDLSRAVCEAGERVRAIVGTGFDLQLSCADTPLWVDIDRHQLDLILGNLAANAREAMPEGGALTIIVQPEDTKARPAPAGDNRDSGPSASLTVSDTGLGMDEATRQRAFEPFFSTKGPGSGAATGMGLAIVHGIVTGLNGRIQVESTPGQGSTFRVLLPLVEPGVAPPAPYASAGDTTFGTNPHFSPESCYAAGSCGAFGRAQASEPAT